MQNSAPTLNEDQAAALAAIEAWLKEPTNENPYFILAGAAGCGKTTLARSLVDKYKSRIVFTAPTNKATKVLRKAVTTEAYKPECRTIYSLLGLQLAPSGEVKELKAPEDPIDLAGIKVVVLDEGSMAGKVLKHHLDLAMEKHPNLKILVLGDKYQLPPVQEDTSPFWRVEAPRAELTKIVRFDNQILDLTQKLRGALDSRFPQVRLTADNANGEGVWVLGKGDFAISIIKETLEGLDFLRPEHTKIIAWRNVVVDNWNKIVRANLFENHEVFFLPEDRVIFTSPAKDLNDDLIANTDDEGQITHAIEDWHPVYGDVKIWRLSIRMDSGNLVVGRVLHKDGERTYAAEVDKLAREAKANPRKWGAFWEYKDAFHGVRHGYAITAHRSQGSTYDTAFVDYRDILINPNTTEAYKCLYVAASRPRRRLFLG